MNTQKLSQEWIAAVNSDEKSSDENDKVIDYVMDLTYDKKFEELWEFIKYTYKQDINEKVTSVLAAGPLEDLLAKCGENYIKEIETLSRQEPKFRHLLGGVWQNDMSDTLWKKVCKFRVTAW